MHLYLTTTGRATGQARKIEIWLTEHGRALLPYRRAESANWARNIQARPRVKLRIGDAEVNATAARLSSPPS